MIVCRACGDLWPASGACSCGSTLSVQLAAGVCRWCWSAHDADCPYDPAMLGAVVVELVLELRRRGTPVRFALAGDRVRLLQTTVAWMAYVPPGREHAIAWWRHPATSAQIRDGLGEIVHPFRAPRVLRKDQR